MKGSGYRMENIKKLIRDVPDFPQKGIIFKDITPLLNDITAFKTIIDEIVNKYQDKNIDIVVAADARGFIFGAPVAYKLNAGFVPVRKSGKLPYRCIKEEFSLEYGTDAFEMHIDAIQENQNILIIDDLLATGGTAEAIVKLVKRSKGNIIGIIFVIELDFLNGREKIKDYNVESFFHF